VSISCENLDFDSDQTKFSDLTDNLRVNYSSAFNIALSSSSENSANNTLDYFNGSYLNKNLHFDVNIFKKEQVSGRQNSIEGLDFSFLSSDEKVIAIPFFELITNIDDLSSAEGIVQSARVQTINSNLSDESKYKLLSYISVIEIGIEIIQEKVENYSNANGRTKACVDVKGALRAGVTDLAIGAVVGGYAGATAGTFTVPVIGTVTGGVAGAVVGGAVGFVEGVTRSILTDLIFGC
jgi:hypothetical protein